MVWYGEWQRAFIPLGGPNIPACKVTVPSANDNPFDNWHTAMQAFNNSKASHDDDAYWIMILVLNSTVRERIYFTGLAAHATHADGRWMHDDWMHDWRRQGMQRNASTWMDEVEMQFISFHVCAIKLMGPSAQTSEWRPIVYIARLCARRVCMCVSLCVSA